MRTSKDKLLFVFFASSVLLVLIAVGFFILRPGESASPIDEHQRAAEAPPALALGRDGATDAAELASGRRAQLDNSLWLVGRCVDENEQGLGGVEVSWVALWNESELGPINAWGAIDWDSLDSQTLSTRSDSAGYFWFDRAPIAADQRASVVWATSIGRTATSRILRECRSEGAGVDLGELRLPAGLGPTFEIVDTVGEPIANAVIEFCGVHPSERPTSAPEEALARRMLHRRIESDAFGLATGFLLPSPCAVRAAKDNLRSGYWRAPRLDDVGRRFVLGEVFSASGTLTIVEGRPTGSPLFVQCGGTDGVSFDWLGHVLVRLDGSWGPVELPLCADYARYHFAGAGGGVFGDVVEREPPRAAEALFVELTARLGATAEFRVVDDEQQPIPGARVAVYAHDGALWRPILAYTDVEGRARVEGCLAGPALVSIRAAGFVSFDSDVLELDDPFFAQTQEIELARAGRIEGRVMHDGAPVEVFDIQFWQGAPERFQTKRFTDRKDGSFELESAPLGDVWLFAASHPFAPSDPISVKVHRASSAEVELTLSRTLRASGRVIDAATRTPIDAASVQLWSRSGSQLMTKLGGPLSTDGDGRFELDGVALDATSLMFEADGYGAAIRTVAGHVEGDEVELADVPLIRKQKLTVQLSSRTPTEFTRYTLQARLEDWNPPPQRFDETGQVLISAFTPGRVVCIVGSDDGAYLMSSAFPAPGRDFREVFELDPSTTLDLRAHRVDGDVLGDSVEAILSYRGPNGRAVENYAARTGPSVWRFPTIPVRRATLTLSDVDGLLVSQRVELSDGPNELELRIPSEPLSIRVVGAHGAPIPSAVVRLDSSEQLDWSPYVTTDADGRARIPSCDFAGLRASIFSVAHGFAADLPVRKPHGADDVVEIVLDAEGELELTLRDGAETLPALTFRLFNRSMSLDFGPHSSDSNGVAVIRRIAAGDSYQAVFDGPGIWREVVALRVGAPRTEVRVPLRRTGTLELSVRANDHSEAVGARIELEAAELGERVSDWLAAGRVRCSPSELRTDSSGRLRVEGLPRGEYRWSCGASGGAIHVTPHSTTLAELQLRD